MTPREFAELVLKTVDKHCAKLSKSDFADACGELCEWFGDAENNARDEAEDEAEDEDRD